MASFKVVDATLTEASPSFTSSYVQAIVCAVAENVSFIMFGMFIYLCCRRQRLLVYTIKRRLAEADGFGYAHQDIILAPHSQLP